MKNNYYAVIMAGGVGSRFWPLSTQDYPKQFHDMLGAGQSLLQRTFQRLNQFIPASQILVLTNARYLDLVLQQLPMMEENQVVLEPAMRNTAPCNLLAAIKIHKMNPDAQIIVAPSDHWIEDEKAFEEDVIRCFKKSSEGPFLCTLGIKPTFPNTGFGYIEFDKEDAELTKKVNQFREKPDYETAKEFLAAGNFLWNAGIFIWSAKTIVEAFEAYQPKMFALFKEGMACYNTEQETDFVKEYFPQAENISIDYAIMEQSDQVFVLPASFDWNDLGTWGSLYDKLEKGEGENAIVQGKVLTEDAQGNMIRIPKDKLAVIDGLKDYIIVDDGKVLMLMPKSKEQDIKQLVARVKETFGSEHT